MESPRVMAKTLKKSCETSAKVTPKCRGAACPFAIDSSGEGGVTRRPVLIFPQRRGAEWEGLRGSVESGDKRPLSVATQVQLNLCLTLCDPVGCSPPGSSVPGIFQAREWGASILKVVGEVPPNGNNTDSLGKSWILLLCFAIWLAIWSSRSI